MYGVPETQESPEESKEKNAKDYKSEKLNPKQVCPRESGD